MTSASTQAKRPIQIVFPSLLSELPGWSHAIVIWPQTGSTQEEKRRVYRLPSGGTAFGGGVGGLAATGIDPSWWIIGGLLSVVVGAFLMCSARRAATSRNRNH